MPLRDFFAFDNEAFVVDPSSPSLVPGSAIINDSDTPIGTIFRYSAGQGARLTVNDTGGDPDVFEDDDAANHVIVDGAGIVADGASVESESFHLLQQLDSLGNPVGAPVTIWVFSQGGVTSNIWGYGTSAELVDGARYEKTTGDIAGGTVYANFVPCFTPGSFVVTPQGRTLIEEIAEGDQVLTRDNGFQAVRWSGRRDLSSAELRANKDLRPVRIAKDTFGEGIPARDISVSPQHRLLLSDRRCGVYFDAPEMLVAASFLHGVRTGVRRAGLQATSYIHLLFDRHEIVFTDGLWSESFHPADYSMGQIGAKQRREILEIFPQLERPDVKEAFAAARPSIKRSEACLLAA